MKEKIIVMLSGGLDSLLVTKILKQKKQVIALYFKIPFNQDSEKEINAFCKKEKIKLHIFDCTKGKLLKEYLDILKKPKHGRGTSMNPCIDCRIFMLKKAKKFADKEKIKFIATGEVLGERPMSQNKRAMEIVERDSGLKERLIRPLCDLGIQGRSRKPQIALAKKFKIDYPHPTGGCILCEKELKKRIEFLIKRKPNETLTKLIAIGRHFLIDNCWIVTGRNENENKIIESIKNYDVIEPSFPAPSAVIFDKCKKSTRDKIGKLILAYSKKGSLKNRKSFEKFKL